MKCQKSSYLFFCSICPQVFCIHELWSLVNFPWFLMHIVGVPSKYDTLSGNKWWVSLTPSHAVILGFRVLEMWFGVAVFCWCVVRVETNAVQFFDFVNDLRFQSFKILAIREPWIAIFQKNSESQNLLWFWILKKIQRTGGFHKGTQQRTSSLG